MARPAFRFHGDALAETGAVDSSVLSLDPWNVWMIQNPGSHGRYIGVVLMFQMRKLLMERLGYRNGVAAAVQTDPAVIVIHVVQPVTGRGHLGRDIAGQITCKLFHAPRATVPVSHSLGHRCRPVRRSAGITGVSIPVRLKAGILIGASLARLQILPHHSSVQIE